MAELRNLKMFTLMPLNAIFGVPAILVLLFKGYNLSWLWTFPINILLTVVGLLLTVLGTYLVFKTSLLFHRVGQGTVAHWDPPKNLVINGIYRYVRNPMVLGILLTIFGEIILFGTFSLVPYFLFLLIGHHILFIKYEEPELAEKFGEDYILYMKNVPRWIPRVKPWVDSQDEKSKIGKR